MGENIRRRMGEFTRGVEKILIILSIKERYVLLYNKYNRISADFPYDHYEYHRVEYDRFLDKVIDIEVINKATYEKCNNGQENKND